MKKKLILFSALLLTIFTLLFTFKFMSLHKIENKNFPTQNTSTYTNSYSQYSTPYAVNKKNTTNITCFNTSGNIIITIPEFIDNMQCKKYTLKSGETLTSIAKNYNSTCPVNTSVKLIKEASRITDANSISVGSKICIPETTLKNGYIHKTKYGDTWNNLCKDYYPIYNSDYMTKLLIFINDLPDDILPLDTEIYLPNINI